MPILIKSSNGQRSCEVVKPNNSETINKLLEALKDLSFTIEVKITDIKKNDQECDEQPEGHQPRDRPQEKPQEKPQMREQAKTSSRLGVVLGDKPELVPETKSVAKRPASPDVGSKMKLELLPEMKAQVMPEVRPDVRPEVKQRVTSGGTPEAKPEEHPEGKNNRINFKLSGIDETNDIVANIAATGVPLGAKRTTLVTNTDMRSAPPTAWVARDFDQLQDMVTVMDVVTQKLDNTPPQPCKVGDYVFAKSIDDQSWYRAKVENASADGVSVYYFDWGIRENITSDRIRSFTIPDLSLSRFPPMAVKIKIINAPEEEIQRALTTDELVDFKFESYNKDDECYNVTLV